MTVIPGMMACLRCVMETSPPAERPRMRRFVDFHTHSTASDGGLSPAELIGAAEAAKLAAVALTDHDTTAGLTEARRAAEAFPRLQFIGGVEVSARFSPGVLHILALDIDESSPALRELIASLRAARDERNPRMIAKLRELGVKIDMQDVLAVAGTGHAAGSIVGRMHMAEALRRSGYVRSIAEAFDRYIGAGQPAFLEKDRIPPAEVLAAITESGGVSVLAHPPQLGCRNRMQLERVVRELAGMGLEAIEAYHRDNTPRQIRLYLDLARRMNLAVTGGSDFHGAMKSHVQLGRPRVPLSAVTGRLAGRLTRKI